MRRAGGSQGWTALLLALVVVAAADARADFSPFGRRPKPPKPGGSGARPSGGGARPSGGGARPSGGASTGGASTGGAASGGAANGGDGTDPKGPSTDALIARYFAVLARDPSAEFPLQRLTQLYRERDGKLDALLTELRKRAETEPALLVAVATAQRLDGDVDGALVTLGAAAKALPNDARPRLALGRALIAKSERSRGRSELEAALPLLKDPAQAEQLTRELMLVSLDLEDIVSAKRWHQELVKRAQGSFVVRAEFGRELLARGRAAEAVAELEQVAKSTSGDARVLAPALRDLGQAQAKLGRAADALKTLERAAVAAGQQGGLEREILELVAALHRQEGTLAALAKQLEANGRSFERVRLLAGVYEELGQVEAAIRAYRQAVGLRSELELRQKIVQLLQLQGDLDGAVREQEALVRSAPRAPELVLQLVEALLQRGDRPRALRELSALEARSAGDEQTLAALVDVYERLEEKAAGLRILERLAQLAGADPRHLVDLGKRLWDDGKKPQALATWRRIPATSGNRATGWIALGEVLIDHEQPTEGLAALRKAAELDTKTPTVKKALALAYERLAAAATDRLEKVERYEAARALWEQLLLGRPEPALAREARRHIVSVLALAGRLDGELPRLAGRFRATPPDLEAGRLLVEGLARQQRTKEARITLEQLVKLAPGDVESLRRLEQLFVQERRLADAILVLERLVKLEPKRAREAYQRMAGYAADLYRDEDAIRYAERAVELNPDDAGGHARLAELYRKRQDERRAIESYRRAIARNERLYEASFALAELLAGRSELDEADRLLRRVVRIAPDDELVSRAARLSLQLDLSRGQVELLERELLPLALASTRRPIFRRLLVEVYGALAFPLIARAESRDRNVANAANAELTRLGERAVKPLLDALVDDSGRQARVALSLLAHTRNRSAAAPLFTFATGDAEPELREQAMLTVGRLADATLVPKLVAVLSAEDAKAGPRVEEGDPISVAAGWALAATGAPAARAPLLELLAGDSQTGRVIGVLGLQRLGERGANKQLLAVLTSPESGPIGRAIAGVSLATLHEPLAEEPLRELVEGQDATSRALAVYSLALLGAKDAPRLAAEALVAPEPLLRRAGAAAAVLLARGKLASSNDPLALLRRPDLTTLGEATLPGPASGADEAAAIAALADELAKAALAAALASPERARLVASLLDEEWRFLPLAALESTLDEPAKRAARAHGERIGAAAMVAFIPLASHPVAANREEALRFLARRPEPNAQAAVIGALRDPDEAVRGLALESLGAHRREAALPEVEALLATAPSWSLRARAATALPLVAGAARDSARTALLRAARGDSAALVREAAVRALAALDGAGARTVLLELAAKEPEPRVRALAVQLAAAPLGAGK